MVHTTFRIATLVGLAAVCAAANSEAVNTDSLPQVDSLTTFSVTSLSNDIACKSTSMQYLGDEKYVQVCDREAAATRRLEDVLLGKNSSLRSNTKTGSSTEKPTSTTTTGTETEAPIPPPPSTAVESYMQILKKDDPTVITKVSAESGSTIFRSVTNFTSGKLLVAKAGVSSVVEVDATTLAEAETPVIHELSLAPRGIAYDAVTAKLFVTDGKTNKIHIFDGQTFAEEESIDVFCGKAEVKTDNLGDAVFIKPYLYVAIEGSSYMVRIDISAKTCDSTWLVDFSTYNDSSYAEADKIISSFFMDTTKSEYVGAGFPEMVIAGNKWTHAYKLNNAASYIINSFILFAITGISTFLH